MEARQLTSQSFFQPSPLSGQLHLGVRLKLELEGGQSVSPIVREAIAQLQEFPWVRMFFRGRVMKGGSLCEEDNYYGGP